MIRHMHIDVRSALKWSNAFTKRMAPVFLVDGIPLRTPGEVRKALRAELALGHKVIPIGECSHFDWEKGCMGHLDGLKVQDMEVDKIE